MKNDTFKQLQEMSQVQLQRLVGQLRYEIQTMSFQTSMGELKTHHLLRQKRRTLARALTILTKAGKQTPVAKA